MVIGLSNPLELLATIALRETLGALAIGEDVGVEPVDEAMVDPPNAPNAPIDQEPVVDPPDTNPPLNEAAAKEENSAPNSDNFKDVMRKYGLPLRPLQPLGSAPQPMEDVDNAPNTSSVNILKENEGAMLRTFAVMKQVVVTTPNLDTEPSSTVMVTPTLEVPLNQPSESSDCQSAEPGTSAQINGDAVTVVWKRNNNCLIKGMFDDDKNAEAWKREIIAKFLPPNFDANGVALAEQTSGRIEIVAANLSQGSRQFLSLSA